jgi:hypothetical protein
MERRNLQFVSQQQKEKGCPVQAPLGREWILSILKKSVIQSEAKNPSNDSAENALKSFSQNLQNVVVAQPTKD